MLQWQGCDQQIHVDARCAGGDEEVTPFQKMLLGINADEIENMIREANVRTRTAGLFRRNWRLARGIKLSTLKEMEESLVPEEMKK